MKKNFIFYIDELHIPIVIRDIILNIWVVGLAVVTACMCIFCYANILYKPQYSSEATFVVSPRNNGSYVSFYASLNTAREMTEVFKEVFTSSVLKRKVHEILGQPDLRFQIEAQVAEGTNILCLRAIAESPLHAHSVMNAVIDNYGSVSKYLFGGVVLDPLKKPKISTVPYKPLNVKRLMIIGGGGAAFLAICLIIVFSVLRMTIKTRACAKRRMGESPLGVLVQVKKNKISKKRKINKKDPLLITNPLVGFNYVETMHQIAYKIHHKMWKNKQKILLVTSVVENEGKSTVAANLALFLERHEHRVAIVDFDLRRPAVYKFFSDFPKKYNLSNCVQEGIPETVGKGEGLLEVFCDSKPLRHSDRILTSEKLGVFLEKLKEKVDYIIIDSAPFTVAADTGMILRNAEAVLMVARQDWVPYGILRDVVEEFEMSDAEYMGYVLNHYRRRSISI